MKPAGIFRRFFALIVDQGIFFSLFLLCSFIIFGIIELFLAAVGIRLDTLLANTLIALFVLFSLVGHWLYFSLYESSRKRGTPGQRLFKLNVSDIHNEQVTFNMASLRYLIWAVPTWLTEITREIYGSSPSTVVGLFLFVLFCVDIIWLVPFFFTERRQTVYDLVSGVQVIKISKAVIEE